MDENNQSIRCACGRVATAVDKLDMGVFVSCGQVACRARMSAAIEEASARHPARLKTYDAIRPQVMLQLGDKIPVDRSLAVVHALLDMAGSIMAGVFRVGQHPRTNAEVDAWKNASIAALGRSMQALEKASTQTTFPT